MSYEKSSIRLQWRDFCNLYIVYYEGIIVTYTSKGLFLQWRDYCNLQNEGLLKVIHRLQWRDYCKLYIKCIKIEYNI